MDATEYESEIAHAFYFHHRNQRLSPLTTATRLDQFLPKPHPVRKPLDHDQTLPFPRFDKQLAKPLELEDHEALDLNTH